MSPQIGSLDGWLLLQVAGGTLSRDPAGLEHVGARAELERQTGILLDEEHRQSGVGVQSHEIASDLLHDVRSETLRQLVDREQIRLRHERPPDGDHLLLPAGEVACPAPSEVPELREQLVDVGGIARGGLPCAEAEVVVHAQIGEQLAALGYMGKPPTAGDRPRTGRDDARERVEQRRLSSSVRPDEGDHLAAPDFKADVVEGDSRAIADDESVDGEQGRVLPGPVAGRRPASCR